MFIVAQSVATADSPFKAKQPTTMYRIKFKMFEIGGESEAKVLATPAVAVAEDLDANFHVGGSRKMGSEQVRFGTMAKARVTRADDGMLTVSGFVEVSTIGEQEDGLTARQSKSLHFSHTVKLGETLTLPARTPTNQRLRLELHVDRIDDTKP